MGMRVSIRGIGNVERNADIFEKKIVDAVRMGMIRSALIDIETVAKRKLTQDKHIDTGRLRASIHTTYKDADTFYPREFSDAENKPVPREKQYNDKHGSAFEAMLQVRRGNFNIFVGTDVVYSKFIERLDSFLFFAFKNAKPKMQRRIKQEVRRVLRG